MSSKLAGNVFYAQSGGVTAVINATAAGVISAAQACGGGKIYVGKNGILGAINRDVYEATDMSADSLKKLRSTPASAFGTCRYKLKDRVTSAEDYQKIVDFIAEYNIKYFFYNGGNDSQHNTHQVWLACQERGLDVVCIGLPKTIDNDLACTDNCPGFGSAAKYITVSTLEAALDVKAMCLTSTKVFIFEVMGRHAGWMAASSALARTGGATDAPHLILLPERAIKRQDFLKAVQDSVDKRGYCVVVASEGVRDAESGKRIAEGDRVDDFGHVQLGGVAPALADWIDADLGLKTHWAVADYLQRSARHIASKADVDQAFMLGEEAVYRALKGLNGHMLTIERVSEVPYRWEIGTAELEKVANAEKFLPDDYIAESGMDVTDACMQYMKPLIVGEDYPEYHDGVPVYLNLSDSERA